MKMLAGGDVAVLLEAIDEPTMVEKIARSTVYTHFLWTASQLGAPLVAQSSARRNYIWYRPRAHYVMDGV